MPKLQHLENFIQLLHAVQKVKRVSRRPDEKEMHNTGEHTFELALMCWYIASTNKLKLNYEKVLKYALAHDIVEAYAGDTMVFDDEATKTKPAREAAALKRIEEEFPEFADLTETIHEYENLSTPEAKFVYAADKLIDPMVLSMEKTQSLWKEYNISWESLLEKKTHKIEVSKDILPYWYEVVKKLEAKKEFFFPNPRSPH